ncbi:MAG: flagellar M-ring protein FliF [Candidatus Latescibacteria bacterium]|nr:flagellar M-ring protein FliF [bacterium]MBD3424480.1 flagellar M-ring protein FliF [Candidatus Latescibacterota bacterium]
MAGIGDTLGQIQGAWNSMSFSQKVIIGGVAGAVIISLIVFSMWLRKPSYAVLFSDLDARNAGEITSELDKMGTQYKVESGGSTIMVPAEKVARLRISLASSGIIKSGGVGYEIFDSNDIGVTDFIQKVNMKRALEGELARTITEITDVEDARVHIVFPKESIFKGKGRDATASVVLNLRGGGNLDESQVRGVANLVSYGVEGLQPGNVSIIDQNGRTLTGNIEEDVPGVNSTRLKIKEGYERYLAGKAENMLSTALGPGKSVVRVNANLDFREIERRTERYDPETVVRSEQTTTEKNEQDGSESESITTNNEINRTVETIVSDGDGVKSLSVAVFVDGHYSENEETGETEYAPLTAEEITKLENIVKNAVGFDPSREDMIVVENIRFYSTDVAPESFRTPVMEWLPGVLGKVATIIIIVMLFIFLRKRLGEVFSGGERSGQALMTSTIPGSGGVVTTQEKSLEDRAKEISDNNPEQVAKLVKTWMAEAEKEFRS